MLIWRGVHDNRTIAPRRAVGLSGTGQQREQQQKPQQPQSRQQEPMWGLRRWALGSKSDSDFQNCHGGAQIFQPPLVRGGSLNHIGVPLRIPAAFLNQGRLKDLV